MKALTEPLMRWLDANTHPHTRLLVDSRSAALVEDIVMLRNCALRS